jgi:uncharacterized SAM-binding protein YcdF (DUF218 family)
LLTLILFLLFGLAALLLLFQRPRLGLGLLVLALALFWVAGSGSLTGWLLGSLQHPYGRLENPAWGRRTAVIVLGAGAIPAPDDGGPRPTVMAYARILEGVRLYRAGQAAGKDCSLLFSGGDAFRSGAPESLVYGQEAKGLGVPQADLILESRSLNTFKNAEYTSALLRAGGFDQAILVTSGVHLGRSRLYFAHFGILAQPAPADRLQPVASWLPLAYNLAMADAALHEYLGILQFRAYNLLGWNPPPHPNSMAAAIAP